MHEHGSSVAVGVRKMHHQLSKVGSMTDGGFCTHPPHPDPVGIFRLKLHLSRAILPPLTGRADVQRHAHPCKA